MLSIWSSPVQRFVIWLRVNANESFLQVLGFTKTEKRVESDQFTVNLLFFINEWV